MPDYSNQLQEIAKALSRPTTPVWLVAAFSALLGVLGGLAGQSLMMVVTDTYRRHKLRRVLYLDLADMFWAVDTIMAFAEMPDQNRWQWQEEQLRRMLVFRGEKYCRDNQEIYIQLPERLAAETLYQRFHDIVDDMHSMQINTGLALRKFADAVHSGSLIPKHFRRFLGSQRATSLLRAVDEYHKRSEELRRKEGLPSNDDA